MGSQRCDSAIRLAIQISHQGLFDGSQRLGKLAQLKAHASLKTLGVATSSYTLPMEMLEGGVPRGRVGGEERIGLSEFGPPKPHNQERIQTCEMLIVVLGIHVVVYHGLTPSRTRN